jgi:hypothetical protein
MSTGDERITNKESICSGCYAEVVSKMDHHPKDLWQQKEH